MKIRKIHLSSFSALAGTVILAAGSVQSILSYNQSHPSRYSFTNHFVSELGWSESSQASALFNGGLIAVNLAFLPMVILIGRNIGTRLGYLAMFSGICTLLAGVGVGIWPLDHLQPHLIAAIAFFWAYLVTVFLFTLAYCPRWNNKPSRAMVFVGTLCCLIAIAFLAFPKQSAVKALQQLDSFQRPQLWWLALLEWGVVFSALLWGIVATLVQWRK